MKQAVAFPGHKYSDQIATFSIVASQICIDFRAPFSWSTLATNISLSIIKIYIVHTNKSTKTTLENVQPN